MKAKHSVWKNKLAKTMFLMAVVSVAALFIGGAASAALRPGSIPTENKTIALTTANARVDGLVPHAAEKYTPYQQPALDRGYFYAYNAYDPGGTQMGPITFDTPDAITLLAPGIFPNFCGGADIESDVGTGNWFGCDYAGGLYLIDRDTGTQTYIGPTVGVNGMTYDGTTDTWYVTSANTLYTMDVTTGATTSIGSHGVSNTFIGLACNIDGDMYGWDVLFTGTSTLYSVDKSTGAATAVGSMGVGLVYAQDGGFDRDNDILYLSAYFNDGSPSALLTCDYSTGACTAIGNFQGGMEVDGFAVPWMGIQYYDDIAVSSIIAPGSGNAGPITPVVRVKNAGINYEYSVPIQLEIGVEQITGTVEDFEATNGSYTHAPKAPQPDVWAWGVPTSGPNAAHSGVNVWATNLAGSYPASMWCYLVTAPFVVPGGALFNFWHWYYFENNYDGGNVKISTDGGTTWTLITPVGGYPGSMPYNPYMVGEPAYNGQSNGWKQANFDLSAYEGETAQIMFETASDSSVQYAGWYIDDVGFTITSWVNEYTETATISSIAPDEVVDLSFPTWTPADLGMVEMVNINYNAEATTMLVGDENPNNDYKAKPFTLHYGYFDDVAVTDIISPVSGLAETQTPEVALENHGQNAENVNVQMTIGKALYTTLLEEDFAGGVPPAGWGTNYPGNWYSSSTNYAGGTAPEAEFSWTPSSIDEHLLYTGAIDTTGFTALALKFKEYVNDYNGDYTLKIVTSTDGGATWNEAWSRAGGPYGPATTDVTLTAANGVGSATLQIAWDMSGDSFNINYWYVDDVWMGIIDMVDEYDETVTIDIAAGASANAILPDWTPSDVPLAESIDYLVNVEATLNGFTPVYTYGFEEAWIPAVPPGAPPFPPAGWNIYNVNTGNTWVQSSSGQHSGSYCAKCTYDYAVQPNDDWLVTKSTVVAPGGIFSVWIDGYSYSDDEFEIWMSTTGNTVNDFIVSGTMLQGVYYPVPTVYTQYTFDMSAYAGQTVWFAIRYVGWYAWYIWADDFTFPDGSFEGFEGGTPGIPGHWPSFNQYVYGTTTDQWLSVTSGTSPTCYPPEGTYMAKYNSYSISSGNSAELDGTVLIDFSSATLMKFQMYHDTGYSGCPEVIYPLLSADGVNFWYDGTGFYRYDGTTGWADETMDYSFLIDYLGGPGDYYIGFYAISYYGNNMYMDDIRVVEASLIDDGYPADNTLGAIITLSYEHDVGVVAITDYPGSDMGRDIIWDNYGDDGTGVGLSSQLDTSYPFNSQCADDFQFAEAMDVTGVHYWGAFWNGVSGAYPNPCEFNVIFYADDGSGMMPTGAGMDDPTSTALAVYNFPAVTGVSYGTDKYEYDVVIDPAFVADAGVKYWVAVQSVFFFSGVGQWGWSTNGANPDQLGIPVQGFPLLGTAYWTQTTYGDHAYQLSGQTHSGGGGGNPPPGTYPIAGTIKNLGVTYSESDIPVNAQVTNDTGVVVYDETVIVVGPLAPGEMASVVFPDITIPNVPEAEYDYKLTMQTMLPGDDHPNNDKKTQTWIIQIPDTTPPTTTATVSGTMGDNDWYVSNVQVTLTATDAKWPTGVNFTMYKVDDGDYTEYSTPIIVDTDGEHTVYFYSVDNAGNVEDEQSVSFKIDKTPATINEFTATAQNALKNKWLLSCDAVDATSGIVKVEFYADDALVGEVTDGTSPYTFEVDGKIHTAQCIVYDAAGNSKLSDVITAYDLNSQQSQFISALQQKLL
jgi:hypothetical protein